MRERNRLIVLALIVLVGGILFFLISQEEQIKLPVQKKIVVPNSVEMTEGILEETIQGKQRATFYTTREINTTMKTEIGLQSEVDENETNYKYIWKENNNIIGFGRNLKKAFSLGEHNLSCQTLDERGGLIETTESINVIAWRYIKEEHYYFDTSTDKYKLGETKFFNYLKQLVFTFTDYYQKEFSYNEYGKIVEQRYENFDNSEYSYVITNSYDGEKLLSMEKTDNEGNIIESHTYDEVGEEIKEIDKKKEPLSNHTQKNTIKVYNKDGNVTHMESANGQYMRNMKYDEKGRLTYKETIYPKGKNSMTKRYNKNGKEIYREYLRLDKEGNVRGRDILTKEYDNDGNLIKEERKYSLKEILVQHTLEKWSYKDGRKLSYETEAFVGTCPCTIDMVKQKYIYHYDKNGTLLSSDYKYQREGDSEFRESKKSKIVKSYSNSLE